MSPSRLLRAACLATCSLGLALPALATSQADLEVRWKGKEYSLEKLQDKLPEERIASLSAALARYGPWATEFEYQLTLDSKGRMLLVHHAKLPKSKGPLSLMEDVLDELDELFPVEAVRLASRPRPASASGRQIP